MLLGPSKHPLLSCGSFLLSVHPVCFVIILLDIEECFIPFFMLVKSRTGDGADVWQNHIPLYFKETYSFMLLLILCQVFNEESKIQLLQWPRGTCLKGGIPRNTKNRETLFFFPLEIVCSTLEYSKYSDTSVISIQKRDTSIQKKVKGILFLIFI